MQSKPAYILSCVIAGLAGTPVAGAAAADGGQWHCVVAAGGGWQCGTTSPTAALPPAPAGPAPAARPPAGLAPGGAAPATATVTAPAPGAATAADRSAAAGATPTAATTPGGLTAADRLAETMDWVPRARLTPAQAATIGPQCGGAYVEPPMEAPDPSTAVIGTIHASANQSELLQDPEIAKFSGNVTLRQGERRLRADQATYYRDEERIALEGGVQYREPGLLVRGDSASIDTAQNTGVLTDTRFVMHREHVRGEAREARRNADRTLEFEETVYTQCEPGHDDWQLAAQSLHIDRESGQGTAHHARLEVKGVPVLYTPYLRFPVDDRRMSGLLWPTFTNSSQNGLDFTAPYYFNLAPNYDATLLPRYMNDRGEMLGGEFRYMNHWSYWVASGAILPDDAVADDDRWLTSLEHTGQPLERLQTRISYTEVSDEEYLRQLSTAGLEVQRSTHLPQMGEVSYVFADDWLASARAQQFQLLDRSLAEPYKMLPRLELNRAFRAGPFAPDYAVASELTVFEHKDPTVLTGQRLYLAPSLGFPMEWAAAFVRPAVGYQSISYQLDDNAAVPAGDDSPSVGAPMASLDAGYFLERDTQLFGADYLQTLEPRAFYLWVQRDDQGDLPNFDSSDLTFSFSQLFRTTRFSGHDRIADANQGSLSVTTRLIDEDDGTERLTASIGQIFYFENRLVTVCQGSARAMSQPNCSLQSGVPEDDELGKEQYDSSSEIAAETQLQPMHGVSLTGTTLWDTHRDQFNEGGVLLRLTPDEQTIVNMGYRYRRERTAYDLFGNPLSENIDQADFSAVLPVGDRWRLFARYQYDFTNNHSLEELTGVEYSSCCWSVRMVYQEGLDWDQGRDYGFYVQFLLRGLGGLGKNIDQLLQDSIFGYAGKQEEYSLAY
jgi:LPS-assembly protein